MKNPEKIRKPAAVITGASRGIGRAIALKLAEEGFNIAGVARAMKSTAARKGLNSLAPEVEAKGAEFLPLQADIRDIDRHKSLIAQVCERFGGIDFLVNNAGTAPEKRHDALKTTLRSFDYVIEVNLRAAFFFTQSAARAMLKGLAKSPLTPPGIVFVTSVSAEVSSIDRAEYCISKAGLSMAAKIFAHRLAPDGINVYEIRPGIIDTDMTAPVKQKYDKLIESGLVPQNRWGTPEDVAAVTASLARGDFAYAAGTIIEAGGGIHLKRL